jgi:hypothetical protein
MSWESFEQYKWPQSTGLVGAIVDDVPDYICGNMYSVMGDLVGMGIDCRHSFEDKTW